MHTGTRACPHTHARTRPRSTHTHLAGVVANDDEPQRGCAAPQLLCHAPPPVLRHQRGLRCPVLPQCRGHSAAWLACALRPARLACVMRAAWLACVMRPARLACVMRAARPARALAPVLRPAARGWGGGGGWGGRGGRGLGGCVPLALGGGRGEGAWGRALRPACLRACACRGLMRAQSCGRLWQLWRRRRGCTGVPSAILPGRARARPAALARARVGAGAGALHAHRALLLAQVRRRGVRGRAVLLRMVQRRRWGRARCCCGCCCCCCGRTTAAAYEALGAGARPCEDELARVRGRGRGRGRSSRRQQHS